VNALANQRINKSTNQHFDELSMNDNPLAYIYNLKSYVLAQKLALISKIQRLQTFVGVLLIFFRD